MLVIRLQRAGKKNQPFFRIVLAEKTSPVKGKFLEKVGFVNPLKKEISVNEERIKYWTSKGAKMSDSVYNILVDKKVLEGGKRIVKIAKKKEKKGDKKSESQGQAVEENKPKEEKEQPEVKEEKKEKPKEVKEEVKSEEKVDQKSAKEKDKNDSGEAETEKNEKQPSKEK